MLLLSFLSVPLDIVPIDYPHNYNINSLLFCCQHRNMLVTSKIGLFSNRANFTFGGKERILSNCCCGDDNGGINSAPLLRKSLAVSTFGVGCPSLNENFHTITSILLNRYLENNDFKGFILDLRDSRHFQNGHIKGAKTANCTTKLMSKKTLMDWKRSDYDNEDHYILYDQQSDLPAANSPQIVLIDYLLLNNKQITYLQGGYDEFKKVCKESLIETSLPKEKLQSYNYSPTNVHINNSEDVLNASASQIFPFIFIGNERDSSDLELLKELEITHILNVTSTSPFYFKNLNIFQYQRLPACDSHMQNLRVLYNEAFNFIDAARFSNGRVLVHCWAGVSRSPSIVIAYLLKHSNNSVLEILKFVQGKRSIVAPNIHFLGQLEKYNLDLNQNLEKRCVDFNEEDFN